MKHISKEQMTQVILLFSCAALVSAWAAQYVFGLEPCILCVYQRYLYTTAIFLLAFNLYFMSGRAQNLFLILTGLVLLTCAGVAAYQVAIENQWVPLPKICEASLLSGSFEDFKEAITSKPYVPCDKVAWSLFGISMAGYSLAYALFLGILSFMGVSCNGRASKKFTRR